MFFDLLTASQISYSICMSGSTDIRKAIRRLSDFLNAGAMKLRVRLGRERASGDGEWKPVVHVMMPDGKEHPFRSKMCMLIPGDDSGDDVEDNKDDQANHIFALLVNGYGEVIYDADTGEPALLTVPAAVLRHDDDRRMLTTTQVAKMAAVDRSTVYRAARAGHLDRHMLQGKHARYVQEQVMAWVHGQTKGRRRR